MRAIEYLILQDLGYLCRYAAVAGVLSHISYFVRGHRTHQALGIAIFLLGIGSAITISFSLRHGIARGVLFGSAIGGSYLASLFISMSIYRLIFHPLAHFPGPLAAKLTKFYGLWIAREGKMHWEHDTLLRKYGNIVRIGPSELLLKSVDAIQKVHGAYSRCSKTGTFYDFVTMGGVLNIDSVGDHEIHRGRRISWDRAFNGTALLSYENQIRESVQDWLDKLSRLEGEPVNTSLFSLLIPFDNIGRVGYSHEFGLVKKGQENHYLECLESVFGAGGDLGQTDWLLGMAKALNLSKEQIEADKLGIQLVDERIQSDSPDKEDILKYMLEDLRAEQPKGFFNMDILYADAVTILVGGTDTIAAVLSYSFYHLAKDPEHMKHFLEDITPVFGKTIAGNFTNHDLETKPWITAFIDEVMRLYNPTCNNGQRRTPPEGIEVDGVFIPGSTNLIVPIHSLHRSEDNFVDPGSFVPERWTTRPELVLNKQAFHPFLRGPYNCPGRRLAYSLIRLVLANTVWHYDFALAPGETGRDIHAKSKNQLILKAGPLRCSFSKRRE